jgi:CheY-like chemotaxis protein
MTTVRPDLIMLDLIMPELGGTDTVAAMRTEPELADIPVILISAQDQLTAQLPLAGSLAISKPDGFQIEEALSAIDALLAVLRPPQAYVASREGAAADTSPSLA